MKCIAFPRVPTLSERSAYVANAKRIQLAGFSETGSWARERNAFKSCGWASGRSNRVAQTFVLKAHSAETQFRRNWYYCSLAAFRRNRPLGERTQCMRAASLRIRTTQSRCERVYFQRPLRWNPVSPKLVLRRAARDEI